MRWGAIAIVLTVLSGAVLGQESNDRVPSPTSGPAGESVRQFWVHCFVTRGVDLTDLEKAEIDQANRDCEAFMAAAIKAGKTRPEPWRPAYCFPEDASAQVILERFGNWYMIAPHGRGLYAQKKPPMPWATYIERPTIVGILDFFDLYYACSEGEES